MTHRSRYFYCHDKESLDDEVGQQVDSILAGGSPPRAKSKYTSGDRCWNYRLFYSRAGGWLNLAMSSAANDRYITTKDKQTGLLLSDICDKIRATVPQADIHWSACRAIEDKNTVYPDDRNPRLQRQPGAAETREQGWQDAHRRQRVEQRALREAMSKRTASSGR